MPPAGTRFKDGHSTTILFENNANVSIWEIRIKPPGLDMGGPNNTTTMRNVVYRTKQPKKLKTMTAMTGTGSFALGVYPQLLALMGIVQLIYVTFPDGLGQLQFYGWLDKFEPNEFVEGEQPTGSFTIEPSNENLLGAEVGLAIG